MPSKFLEDAEAWLTSLSVDSWYDEDAPLTLSGHFVFQRGCFGNHSKLMPKLCSQQITKGPAPY
jgi:hypothetical protein